MIAEHDVARLTEQLMPAAESLSDTEFGGATEFEFKTALGFAYWKERKCEWVALEVGLGGRLDATNVVHPKVCVIVSVGLDHTAILGDTVEAIAHEKAGIIKQSVPVVVGEVPRTALEVIEEIAAQRLVERIERGRSHGWNGHKEGELQRRGARHSYDLSASDRGHGARRSGKDSREDLA